MIGILNGDLLYCFWSSIHQRRQDRSLIRGEEASKEDSYNWSGGGQNLVV